jgi:hypothetical protein
MTDYDGFARARCPCPVLEIAGVMTLVQLFFKRPARWRALQATTNALGLTLPSILLAGADEVLD